MKDFEEIAETIDSMNEIDNKPIEEIIDDFNDLTMIQNKLKNVIENYRPILIEYLKDKDEKTVDMKGNTSNLRSTRVDSFEVKRDAEGFADFAREFDEGKYRDDIVHSVQMEVQNDCIKKAYETLQKAGIMFEISKESYSVINKEIKKNEELKDLVLVNHTYRFKKIK